MPKAKPLAPELAALIPDGIEKFIPRCIVCSKTVPANRARGRSKDTCSPACHRVRQLYRTFVVLTSKCLACHHPSSPTERADFIRWRKDRGHIRDRMGRPPVKIRRALIEAVAILGEYLAPDDEYLALAIAKFAKVLAPQKPTAAPEIPVDIPAGDSLACEELAGTGQKR
jgi:hypothetical protein